MENSKISVVLIAIIVVAGAGLYFYSESAFQGSSEVFVLHAGSLTKPFHEINKRDNKVNLRLEDHGSVEVVRFISEGGRNPDVAAVSDYSLIGDFLISEEFTDWYIQFARNNVVLCYTDQSKYSEEIDNNNWYKILSKSDVKFGFGNPNADPGGYRVMMVIQLAEIKYDNSQIFDDLIAANTAMKAPEMDNGKYIIKAKTMDQLKPSSEVEVAVKEVAVIPKLETGSIDYMFNYRSIAKQHDFKYVKLPDQINLSRVKHADIYKKVGIKLTGGKVKMGKPIVYGITILNNAKNKGDAVDFLKYLLSEKGQKVLENMGQQPVSPPRTNNKDALPQELQKIVKQVN
ncbi:hypothetical protein AKJ63_01160 [candidate division MSBL1 archaeon SCGC-AAA259D18]|uniref:Tungstate ABC transporter substrate-binding protein WtpA n=1 Tax=candidate division MSBL1 archaeon SCGC-AAA259D18 TaxID=1698262 RepID=A0A133UBT1_9EURY|nr:hypothetical protein AKJ63_01160 [candidate division MSBL1 archaeon SCGC-AAA259D18]